MRDILMFFYWLLMLQYSCLQKTLIQEGLLVLALYYRLPHGNQDLVQKGGKIDKHCIDILDIEGKSYTLRSTNIGDSFVFLLIIKGFGIEIT
ncbi:hypothetical protein CDL12_29450 [Handroanthus impetiginosus]|uniref:Uncharacterized protein n=1 Tax=Handroanthus impetiginosus TaxID=429701 RepID=A0A2G9FYD2_9LAMI|nr:hypothetical protein CDL12_29450 [Handroanthus impetiginosus]